MHAWLQRTAHVVVLLLEAAMMLVLAVVVVLAIAGFGSDVIAAMRPPFLEGNALATIVSNVLEVFVLIELLATALAYLRGTDVIRRLFETMFVALARKLITLELGGASLEKAVAVAVLLLASAVAWWLVARATDQASLLSSTRTSSESAT